MTTFPAMSAVKRPDLLLQRRARRWLCRSWLAAARYCTYRVPDFASKNLSCPVSASCEAAAVLELLAAALAPLLGHLQAWLAAGVLDDPCAEFLVAAGAAARAAGLHHML